MKRPSFLAAMMVTLCLPVMVSAAAKNGDFASVDTAFKLVGANHKIVVLAYDDPKIPQITCYISQAKTGGISGSIGVAEDPSQFDLSCVKTGAINAETLKNLTQTEQAFEEKTNLWFKSTRVFRKIDHERKVVVYFAVSKKLIEGSPKNAISAVAL